MTPGESHCLVPTSPTTTPPTIRRFTLAALNAGVQLFCTVYIDFKKTNTLLDCGAGVSVVNKDVVEKVDPIEGSFEVVTANGSQLNLVGQVKVVLCIGNLTIKRQILVATDLPKGLFVLGNDIIIPLGVLLNSREKYFEIDGSGKVPITFVGGDETEIDDTVTKLKHEILGLMKV